MRSFVENKVVIEEFKKSALSKGMYNECVSGQLVKHACYSCPNIQSKFAAKQPI